MSIKRNRSPRVSKSRRKRSYMKMVPFIIPVVSRNQDLFSFQPNEKTLIAVISFYIDRIKEDIEPVLRIILNLRDTKITKEVTLEQGSNSFSFNQFMGPKDTLVFDFKDVDSVYKNIRGISGTLEVRS